MTHPVLFWDFDGTLTYTGNFWSRLLHRTLREHCYTVPLEAVREHLLSGFSWHSPEQDYRSHTGNGWWELLYRHLDRLYRQWRIPSSGWAGLNGELRKKITDSGNYRVYEDARQALARCVNAGCRNYLLSNNYPELPSVVENLGLAEFFSGMVVSSHVGFEKPRREIFDLALELAKAPPLGYMIGDNPAADIRGGRQAGLRTILVHHSPVPEADHVCGELLEIPAIVAGDI